MKCNKTFPFIGGITAEAGTDIGFCKSKQADLEIELCHALS